MPQVDAKAKMKILVVDDVEINRLVLADVFSDTYDVIEAENGQVALDLLNEYPTEIVAVLLDIIMPVMDGFEVLRRMNLSAMIQRIPVIMITGENSESKMLMIHRLGVSDVINKPFNSEIVQRRVTNVVQLYLHKRELEEKLAEQKAMLEKQALRLRRFDQFVIDTLSTTVEFRDLESGEHIKRVRLVTRLLMEQVKDEYGLDDAEIDIISNVSALHDIGKIAIPDAILLKPGRLTAEEFEIMKTHTIRGGEILSSINDAADMEYFKYSYDICRHHHERWDGKGYPDGLKGDDIAIWAQATSLADVFDALTTKRVYKDAYTQDTAVQMIMRGECGTFNPRLLKSFLEIQPLLAPKLGH